MNLIQLNLSTNEIRGMFRCGGYRINRLRKILDNPDSLKSQKRVPAHAVKRKELISLKKHLETYETEDGFPCAHRRPLKYFTLQGLTWLSI